MLWANKSMKWHPTCVKYNIIERMQLLSHIYSQHFSSYYNIKMLDQQRNLLVKYAKKIRNVEHFEKILDRQEHLLDFKPFKIQNLTPQKALKTYKILQGRYYITRELTPLSNGWYQYQKGLFVWFMVIHAYYLAKEGIDLGVIPEKRGVINFEMISRIFFFKSTLFLEFQFLNLIKTTDKIIWTEIEDNLLTEAIRKLSKEKWTEISMEIFVTTNRQKFISSKHCRERWHNHLDATKIKGNWQPRQDMVILEYVLERGGKKWSKMKIALGHRRTEHMIKNRYHSLITRNKSHRNDKEYEIAHKVLDRLRSQVPREEQSKPEELHQENDQKRLEMLAVKQEKRIQMKLKQQNVSSESESCNEFANEAEIQEEKFKNKIQIKKEKDVKEEYLQMPEENIKSVYKQHMQEEELPEDEDGNIIYPFQNYNYQLEINNYKTQMFEFHKNQMMFYQQYMNYSHAIPTAETHTNPIQLKSAEKQPENAQSIPNDPNPILKAQ